jgi:hypothetical protein
MTRGVKTTASICKALLLIPDLSKWNLQWTERQTDKGFSVYSGLPVNTTPQMPKPHSSM